MIVAHDPQRRDAIDALMPIYSSLRMARLSRISTDGKAQIGGLHAQHIHTQPQLNQWAHTPSATAPVDETRGPIYASSKKPTPHPPRIYPYHARRGCTVGHLLPHEEHSNRHDTAPIYGYGRPHHLVPECLLLVLRALVAHLGAHLRT